MSTPRKPRDSRWGVAAGAQRVPVVAGRGWLLEDCHWALYTISIPIVWQYDKCRMYDRYDIVVLNETKWKGIRKGRLTVCRHPSCHHRHARAGQQHQISQRSGQWWLKAPLCIDHEDCGATCNERRLDWPALWSTDQLWPFCKGHSEQYLTACDWGFPISHAHNDGPAAHEPAVRYHHDTTQGRCSLRWRRYPEADIRLSLSAEQVYSPPCFPVSFWRCWPPWAHLSTMTQPPLHHTGLKGQQACLSEAGLHRCLRPWGQAFIYLWPIHTMSASI